MTSCAFVVHIADPKRFGRARDAGACFGLTPGQDQSGDEDAPKHVTKSGSALMRHLPVTAANYILRASSPDTALKRHGEPPSSLTHCVFHNTNKANCGIITMKRQKQKPENRKLENEKRKTRNEKQETGNQKLETRNQSRKPEIYKSTNCKV